MLHVISTKHLTPGERHAPFAFREDAARAIEHGDEVVQSLFWTTETPSADARWAIVDRPGPDDLAWQPPELACPVCGVDHLEPPFELAPAPIVVITAGEHAGKIGPAVEWRRWDAPAWMAVVVGVDQDGFEISVHVAPCQLMKWDPTTRRQVP